jgi:hypothetical protein
LDENILPLRAFASLRELFSDELNMPFNATTADENNQSFV